MAGVHVAIEVDAPPATVWDVVEQIEHHVDWMHDAVAIHFAGEQRRGVGTSFVCDTKVGPISLADRMTITEWQPQQAMGVRHAGIVTGEGMFRLEPIDFGRRTRFSWSETLHFPWWLGGSLGARLAGALVLRRIWQRNLRDLRAMIEA